MDEAVGLVLAAPVVALALWVIAFVGGFSNGAARATVAAEMAAQAAADASGPEAAGTAARVALGATLSACTHTTASLVYADAGRAAAVTVVCETPGPVSGNRVCIIGYAQVRPAVSAHAKPACGSS